MPRLHTRPHHEEPASTETQAAVYTLREPAMPSGNGLHQTETAGSSGVANGADGRSSPDLRVGPSGPSSKAIEDVLYSDVCAPSFHRQRHADQEVDWRENAAQQAQAKHCISTSMHHRPVRLIRQLTERPA